MSEAALKEPVSTLPALVAYLLKNQARSALIWGLILGLYAAAMTAAYTALGGAQQMEQVFAAYPKGILEAFGVEDMSTPAGFLSGEVFNLVPLALAFFPILACAGAIAGSEERGTMDVLLGNPLPRWQIVGSSALATAISLLGIAAIVGVLMYGTALAFDVDLSLQASVAAVVNLWPLCAFFGALALLFSALFHRRVLAIALPGFVLLAMYLADSLGRVSEDLEGLRDFSAFYYYGAAIQDGIDWTNFAGLSGCALLLTLLAVLVFRRRDIYT